MADIDLPALSRRQFLGACGACATASVASFASTPAAADVPSRAFPSEGTQPQAAVDGREQLSSVGEVGTISAEGRAAISAVDDQLAQQGGNFGQTVDAVSGLGLDPIGKTPISQPLEAAMGSLSNARIVFPSDGVFRLTDRILLNPSGPVELVGNGATLKLDPNTEAMAFDCPSLPGGTRISGFTIDQTAQGSVTGVRFGTEGTIEVRDVTVRGYSTPKPSIAREGGGGTVPAVLMPIARTPSSTVRLTNFTAIGGSAAGMHSDPNKPSSAPENSLGAPMGMWVGQSSPGMVQLVNPRMRGWSNGTYSARTEGTVQILGGMLWNNSNTQARVGGGSTIDGTTMVLDDRQWSMKQNPGPYTLGGNQGVHAVRVETGGSKGNQSDPVALRNLDVRGLSMEISSGLIDFEGSAPAGVITNCRLVNHLGVPAIYGEAPGSQGGYGAAAQTNILVDYCLFAGSTADPAIRVEERPDSRIQRTCIQIPDAEPDSISGMQIGQEVGFGQTCSAGGLKAPKKVGSGANVSSFPPPRSASVDSPTSPIEAAQNWLMKGFAGIVVAPVLAIFFFFVILLGPLLVLLIFLFAGKKALDQ